jgi:membrane protein DedA with SNARE-associated domain
MFGWIFWIIGIIAAVWVIVDVLTKQKGMDQTEKIVWVVCAVLFSIITAIVYWFLKKR